MHVSDLAPYEGYFTHYISKVEHLELTDALTSTQEQLDKVLGALSDTDMAFRYAEGKWTVAQLLLHTSDTERIMTYRALRAGRGDATELRGFEQDDLTDHIAGRSYSRKQLQNEASTLRLSTLQLFESFTEEDLLLHGNFSGENLQVAGIGFMIAGHQLHHIEILKERYLPHL